MGRYRLACVGLKLRVGSSEEPRQSGPLHSEFWPSWELVAFDIAQASHNQHPGHWRVVRGNGCGRLFNSVDGSGSPPL